MVKLPLDSRAPESVGLLSRVDHLVYATPDLDATVDALAEQLGVRATPGGAHPGQGTRNALLALGPTAYLEIVGPDPEQPPPELPRWFHIDLLDAPRLVAWAAKDAALERRAADAARAHFPLGAVESGSRRRPNGQIVAWRFTNPRVLAADGVIPFFIDWGTSPHPAGFAPKGVRLTALRAEHPDAEPVRTFLRTCGLDMKVGAGARPLLVATLAAPRGTIEIL